MRCSTQSPSTTPLVGQPSVTAYEVTDGTPSNLYSLLSTIQHSFGLGCLANTCDTTNVKPLSQQFAVIGSHAVAITAITPPNIATPTPPPSETPGQTSLTPSGGGFTVQRAATLGGGDNRLGAVAVAAANDAWAVGQQVGAGGFDQALAEHRTATPGWHVVPNASATAATASTMLFSVTRSGDGVYASGQTEGATAPHRWWTVTAGTYDTGGNRPLVEVHADS